jgi:predicted acetyltransferase
MMSSESMDLVWPEARYLAGYVHALQQGWSPDNLRPQAALDELARIDENPERFVSEQVDREAKGPAITLPDGSTVPRLPGYHMWMWDGEFCGSVGLRWQIGTTELPPYCLRCLGA